MVWRDKPFRIPQDYCPCRPTTILTGSLKKRMECFCCIFPMRQLLNPAWHLPCWSSKAEHPELGEQQHRVFFGQPLKGKLQWERKRKEARTWIIRGGEEQHGNRKGITTVPEQKGFPTGSPRRATYACFNSWNILLVSQITNKITWGGGKTDRWKSNLLALVPTSHTPPVAEPLAQLPWLEHCKSPPNFLHLLSPLQDQRPCYGYNTSAWTLTWILHQLCYFEAQFSFSFMTWCKPRCFGFQKKRSSVVCSTSSYLPNISEPF